MCRYNKIGWELYSKYSEAGKNWDLHRMIAMACLQFFAKLKFFLAFYNTSELG